MKRLIIMLAIFLVMIGFAVFELTYLNNFYSCELELLHTVEVRFDEAPDNLNREETERAFELAFDKWKENKSKMMMLSNHNAAKFIDEKMVSLNELIRMNQEYDSYVALKTVISYLKELKNDLFPLPSNIF